MNEELEKFVNEYLDGKGGCCTKDDLFPAVKKRFEKVDFEDEELESELVKSTKITGTVVNGTQYYRLRPKKPVGLP